MTTMPHNTYICFVSPIDGNRYGRTTIEAASSFAARREYLSRYQPPGLGVFDVVAVAVRYMSSDASSQAVMRIPAAPMQRLQS